MATKRAVKSKSKRGAPVKIKSKLIQSNIEECPIAGIDYKLNLPSDHFSITQLGMVLRCPRQYYYRYVLGKISPPEIAMLEGLSHHRAVQATNEHCIAKGKHLPVPEIVDIFCEDFLTTSKDVEDWKDEKCDNIIKRGQMLLPDYMRDFGKQYRPTGAEKEVRVSIAGVPMLGYIDMMDDASVWDLKVKGRVPSAADLREDIQLTYYAYAAERDTVGQVVFKKASKPTVEVCPSFRDRRADTAWLARLISENVRIVSAGLFPPCDPTSWVCSPRFCGYYSICKGKVAR